MTGSEDLDAETAIVWTENVDRFDYVRQSVITDHPRRVGPIRPPEGRAVGYTELHPDAPAGTPRRVFWVKPTDRSELPSGPYRTSCPHEAVDPRTVSPGGRGEITNLAEYGD